MRSVHDLPLIRACSLPTPTSASCPPYPRPPRRNATEANTAPPSLVRARVAGEFASAAIRGGGALGRGAFALTGGWERASCAAKPPRLRTFKRRTTYRAHEGMGEARIKKSGEIRRVEVALHRPDARGAPLPRFFGRPFSS